MSLFAELKRRNVFRVGIAYIVATWLLLQVLDIVVPLLHLPEWVGTFFLLLLIVGFIPAVIFAWAFELTPEGLKKESEVDRTQSITAQTGRKLDFAIIAVLAVAVAWFAWDKFGRDGSAPTVPGRVAETQAPATEPPVTVAEKSLAVVPFVAMSSGPDDEFFADGLTEEILNSLAQLPELLVTARTSAFRFKGEDLPPIREIAQTLGVRHIVEGSVRRSGDRLRVTAQLIRAEDEFHLWSENYDSTSADTIAVQEDIAEKIAVAMDVVLDDRKRELMRQAGLRDVEAFIAWQKGREWYDRSHGDFDQIEGLRRANRYFEEVIARVPSFSPAYAAHSDLFIHLNNNLVTRQGLSNATLDETSSAHANAVADLTAAYQHARTTEERILTDFDLAFVSGNWRGITGRFELTLGITGCDKGSWTAPFANLFGYAEPFRKRAEAERICDPLVSSAWFDEARSALWAGQKEHALAIARQGSETAPGGWVNMVLFRAMVLNGLHEEALQEIDNRVQNSAWALVDKALIAASQGQVEKFNAHFEAYLADPQQSDFWTLILYAWSGNLEAANRMAAEMDRQPNSAVPLMLTAYWCACGTPWQLDATPNFAAKLEEGNLPWPPPSPLTFPLKDW